MASSVALLALLTACSDPAPATVPSPSAAVETPTPTPSASSPTEEAIAAGDCAALLSTDELQGTLGVTTELNDEFTGPVGDAPVDGISCDWHFGEPGDPAGVHVKLRVAPDGGALPEDAAAADHSWTCAENLDLEVQNAGCVTTATTNGWWYELRVYLFSSPEEQRAAAAAVDELVVGLL